MEAPIPPDGPVQLGSVQLPSGRQLCDWDEQPLLWATSTRVTEAADVWLRLHDLHEQTGLAPILLAFLDDDAPPDGRPWDSGELGDRADLAEIDNLDAAEVLAQSWADSLDPDDDDPEQAEVVAPFSLRFPGLALRQKEELSPSEITAALSPFKAARIGLVPTRRSADVLALVGYNGTVNRYGSPAGFSAVLRSWEERFGAVMLEVGFAHVRLLVRRPPRTPPAADAAAAEIWAMCDEFWTTGRPERAFTSVSEISEYILGTPIWSLWLD